jgi:hypothetical protein
MRPVPAVILGGVILGMALALPGCGEDGTTAAGQATTARQVDRLHGAPGPRALARRCRRQAGPLLDVLDALRNQVAVGVSYEPYLDLVGDARAVHAEVPSERLAFACLTLVGAPAERALNEYIAGVNIWGDCLADASCEVASVEARLQRRWDAASDLLSTAAAGLRELGSAGRA